MRIKLDLPLSIGEICEWLNTPLPICTQSSEIVKYICTDTRECHQGDLFIALDGENDSGEKYVNEALKKKCLVLSSSLRSDVVHVYNTADALLELSRVYKNRISPRHTVAITGSVGKSTTVKFTSTILKEKFKVHSPVGNFNNHIGLPLTIFAMPKDTEVLVAELGMNHKGEISKLSRAVSPDVAVITSIGTAHIGNLGSRKEIAKAKLEILDGMKNKNIILPELEELLRGIDGASYVGRNSSLSTFSLNDTDSDAYSFVSRTKAIEGIRFFDKRDHLLNDLAFAIAVSDVLGLSEKELLRGIGAINDSHLRQRFIELDGFTVFDDSYNASLESITADLIYISSLGMPTGAFIGDVLELGDRAHKIHEQIGLRCAELKIGTLYLFGIYAEDIARGALMGGMDSTRIFINTDTSSARTSVEQIYRHHMPGEIILFKASHRLRLDKIADSMKNEEGSRYKNE